MDLEEVGRRFADNRIFLPQVMQSAETMQSAFGYLKKIMAGQTGPSRGRILMATVEGDIHDIGKSVVGAVLQANGFDVIDLGIDVDEDGRVYMVDQYFRKVDIYRPVTLGERDGFLGGWDLQ